jgi:hypothetical protein
MPAKSKKQERFMQAVANNPEFAKKVGVPTKVGKEFVGKKKGGEIKGKELQRLLEKERRNEPGLEGFYPEEYIVVPGKALKAGSVLLDAGLEKAQASGLFKRGGKVKKYEKGGMTKFQQGYAEGVAEGTAGPMKKAAIKGLDKITENTSTMKRKGKMKEGYDKGKKEGEAAKKYKTGGKVSSCSKRGDGCAVRGKTKGRMV